MLDLLLEISLTTSLVAVARRPPGWGRRDGCSRTHIARRREDMPCAAEAVDALAVRFALGMVARVVAGTIARSAPGMNCSSNLLVVGVRPT